MTEQTTTSQTVYRWYTRPVFFVADVNRAVRFYVDMLGFEKAWHTGDGAGKVCQVNHGECEIILCEDATRRDKGRLFIELTADGSPIFALSSSSALFPPRKPGGDTTRFRSTILMAMNCSSLSPSKR